MARSEAKRAELAGRSAVVASARCRQRGVTSIEYALLASLIAVVVMGSVSATGTNLTGLYEYVRGKVVCALSAGNC